ncbi:MULTISPECIES: winged helix-turn-helix domain-containing protein [Hydrogenophaga]|uniref:ModE family transcriptional regulator n=1 Tax=Hydrogenophaga electricum TaxID=1230953 RepID=A0ABQ6CC02_9BURK|nr:MULTISPECIES: LysR family transcriptional regulator [Hydrogenophaga]GLS15786.1 ModE family transcriptional regulator [Hydrogenophaga electricum]
MKARVEFRVRVYRDDGVAIGPGKVRLLECIAESGSIAAAARQLGMSYARAWQLVSEMNAALKAPAVYTAKGGARGGGTGLTPSGLDVVRHYRALEASARTACAPDIAALTDLLAG